MSVQNDLSPGSTGDQAVTDMEDNVFLPEDGQNVPSNPLLQELPSYQSILRRGTSFGGTRDRKKSLRNRMASSVKGAQVCSLSDETDIQEDELPLRECAICMEEKRKLRNRQQARIRHLTKWEQWEQSSLKYWKKSKDTTKAALLHLQLWRCSIRDIEGKFGTGIQSYFSFLRFLVLLNFLIFLLMFGFVTLPIIISKYGIINSTAINTSSQATGCEVYVLPRPTLAYFYRHIIDFLSGTGFLELTYLFYGYYKTDNVYFQEFKYNIPLAYLLVTVAYLLVSLLWIVRRSVLGFKQNLVLDEDRYQTFCNKIFTGWDFCITDVHTAKLKHSSLHYELKTDLEEEKIREKIAKRTRKDKCRIYFLRVFLNIIVISVLAGCFYSIYRATVFSQYYNQINPKPSFIVGLIVEYLPSMVITFANSITPIIFDVIIQFEDYSPAFEIRFALMRCVFVRLASIGVLLFTLWSQITSCSQMNCAPCGYNYTLYPCWETRVGQEMYKLMMFDFIVIAAVALFVEFPRKLIVTYCSWKLFRWWGVQEFAIPQNVLEIVYGQTICWIGTFYSPLLPAIATVKYFIVFYIKKISLMSNCRPATRPFRASSSNFFFFLVLLIGLILAYIPVGISIAHINSSKACGPFVNFNTTWQVVPRTIDTMPEGLQNFFYGIGSEAFAVPFFVVICLIMFYFIALAGAHKKVVLQLREQLQMEGRDKLFLIRKIMEAQTDLRYRNKNYSRGYPSHAKGTSREQPSCGSEIQPYVVGLL
ncbi:transmembrane channel-like protein 7 isoform X2 [Protopterus annectens]|uniref:transmembrane channel-like protein 7 isoform X2 n=1 Tax=Protopterus annectens TaxID=7888 RepID=UPI001CF9BE5E|nr:transmembrane channel-like protein 7 isoform X2 [Protopterus annectens]